ncbi:MAG: hypothetical protein HUU06_06785 [Planctomycetaceae bacterium]|nr:hypothetical protein [Planctomycetaceae bacterium]
MSGLTLSLPEVFVGDTLTFTASVQAGSSGQLLLQGAETEPLTTGPWTPVVLQPGEQRGFELVRTVADVPGVYEPTLRLGGVDPTMVYLAKQTLDGTPLTVRRHPVPLPLQDTLAASLGPSGEERVELRLVKGLKFTVELNDAAWEGGRTLQLLDPSGAPVKGFAPGKAAKAKGDGVHVLVIRNIGDAKGNYRLFTAAAKSAPKVKGAGALDATGPVEVPFFAAARTGGTLSVKGSKKLGARIASLRSPSGKTVAVAPGASVEVEEFGEDGTWTAIVEGAEGESGKVKITGKTAWTAGEQVTR